MQRPQLAVLRSAVVFKPVEVAGEVFDADHVAVAITVDIADGVALEALLGVVALDMVTSEMALPVVLEPVERTAVGVGGGDV